MSPGVYWSIQFLSYELVFGRVDKLSLCFGYAFVIVAFLSAVYALHIKHYGQHSAAFLTVGSTLGDRFCRRCFHALRLLGASRGLVGFRRLVWKEPTGLRRRLQVFDGSPLRRRAAAGRHRHARRLRRVDGVHQDGLRKPLFHTDSRQLSHQRRSPAFARVALRRLPGGIPDRERLSYRLHHQERRLRVASGLSGIGTARLARGHHGRSTGSSTRCSKTTSGGFSRTTLSVRWATWSAASARAARWRSMARPPTPFLTSFTRRFSSWAWGQ